MIKNVDWSSCEVSVIFVSGN